MNFEEIYHQHKNRVFNLALQYVQNTQDAEEITQDVFVSVHQSLSNFKAQAKISTWIYRITINKALDYTKASQRQKRFAFFTSLFHLNSNEVKHDKVEFNHPGVQLEHKEALHNLFKHINELPDKQKTVLILNKIEHQSLQEIAEIMNLSHKAVESLLQRARQNLSKKLKPSEGN